MIKVSKWFYGGGTGVFLLLAAISRITGSAAGRGKTGLSQLLLFIAMLFGLALFHKAWLAIQDGFARTTPGRAVGYSFIPIFNLYWMFVVMVGFATDYNSFVERKKLDRRPLSAWLFWALAVTWALSWLPRLPAGGVIILLTMILQVWAVFKIAAAVDGLPIPEPLPEPAAEPQPGPAPAAEGGEIKPGEAAPPAE